MRIGVHGRIAGRLTLGIGLSHQVAPPVPPVLGSAEERARTTALLAGLAAEQG